MVGDMGILALERGEYETAGRLYRESLALHRKDGTAAGVINSLNCLGSLCRMTGDAAQARAFYLECRDLGRNVGNRRGEMLAIMSLSNLSQDRGAAGGALDLALEALAIAGER